MADIVTQSVPRKVLADMATNHRLVKLLEDLITDVSITLPGDLASIADSVDSARALAQLTLASAREAVELAMLQAEKPASVPAPVEAFPVGAVFIGSVATNPSDLLGYGVWSAYGAGQVLVGYAAGDPDFGTPGGTGGAKTKAISPHAGTAVANHADHTHTVTSDVSETSALFTPDAAGATAETSITNHPVTSTGASAVLSHTVTQPNDHTALNVIQPYLTVYFWLRTA